MDSYLTTISFPGQNQWLKDYGDLVFEEMCDAIPERTFTVSTVFGRIPSLEVFSPGQQRTYIRLILNNLSRQPDEPPVIKQGHSFRWT